MKKIQGRVIRLGDDINTDVIAPGRWKSAGMDVLKEHTMEALEPAFAARVQPGDILVAGKDFGCGSHREQATEVMQVLGIQAVVAESIARIYFRNGIALGLPVFSVSDITALVQEGDILEIDTTGNQIVFTNMGTGDQIKVPSLPQQMLDILEFGGIFPYLKHSLNQ